jgi:hypothetical protein
VGAPARLGSSTCMPQCKDVRHSSSHKSLSHGHQPCTCLHGHVCIFTN